MKRLSFGHTNDSRLRNVLRRRPAENNFAPYTDANTQMRDYGGHVVAVILWDARAPKLGPVIASECSRSLERNQFATPGPFC